MNGKPTPSKSMHPVLATLAGIVFVSTASLLIRFAQAEASSIVIAAARMTVASLILVPLALIRNRRAPVHLTWQEWGKGLLAGLFLALHFATWITSLEYTSIASSVVLVTTTPLWVALLSPLVLKEKIRKAVWIGLVVSVVGGVIVGLANACSLNAGGIRLPGAGFHR